MSLVWTETLNTWHSVSHELLSVSPLGLGQMAHLPAVSQGFSNSLFMEATALQHLQHYAGGSIPAPRCTAGTGQSSSTCGS